MSHGQRIVRWSQPEGRGPLSLTLVRLLVGCWSGKKSKTWSKHGSREIPPRGLKGKDLNGSMDGTEGYDNEMLRRRTDGLTSGDPRNADSILIPSAVVAKIYRGPGKCLAGVYIKERVPPVDFAFNVCSSHAL